MQSPGMLCRTESWQPAPCATWRFPWWGSQPLVSSLYIYIYTLGLGNILGTLRTPTTWHPTTHLDPNKEGICINSNGVPGSRGPKSPETVGLGFSILLRGFKFSCLYSDYPRMISGDRAGIIYGLVAALACLILKGKENGKHQTNSVG